MADSKNEGLKKYNQFVKVVIEAYPTLEKQKQYKKAQELWKDVKGDKIKYDVKVLQLKTKKAQGSGKLMSFWNKAVSPPSQKPLEAPVVVVAEAVPEKAAPVQVETVTEDDQQGPSCDTPAQAKTRKSIGDLKGQLASLLSLKQSGMSMVTQREIECIKGKLKKEESHLGRLMREADRQRKRRFQLKEGIETVCNANEDAAGILKSFNRVVSGRPRVEVDQPGILTAIVDIVQSTTAAHDRRRSECLRTVTTLGDLHDELAKLGFHLSRSATYLRLLPRRGNTSEGKRHVQTVPVKLLRPENSLRSANEDRMYAKSFIDDMFDVCKLLGPDAVLFMSNDDKARVPLGLAAANKQAPILMHMEYRIILPDHDFVIGSRHKLIPSVYGICEVTKTGEVSYSGTTFIRIRSGKHDSSNAYTHAYDMQELFKCGLIKPKPILLMETDGAQDEAPRFPKTLSTEVDLFKSLNLDALLHGVNAAGLSAFNPVERRMAPLSHDLAGIVLPHDTFGNHMDASGKTIDEDLEKQNFLKAAEVLSEIWSNTVIDGRPVDCIAVPVGQEHIPLTPDAKWVSRHVQQSRYCMQIVKCFDLGCCKPFVTDWQLVFPDRFIPFPAIYRYGEKGMSAVEPSEYFENPKRFTFAPLEKQLLWQKRPSEATHYNTVPFDIYCQTMRGKLDKGICNTCGQYWPSEAAMKRHRKGHRNERKKDELIEDEVETFYEDEDEEIWIHQQQSDNDNMPVFTIYDILKSPFVEESDYLL